MARTAPLICLVQDGRLSRERNAVIASQLAPLRTTAEIEILKPETTEAELLARAKADPPSLYLVPTQLAPKLVLLEAALGQTRTGGPLIVAYSGEPLYTAPPVFAGIRPIFLNLADLSPALACATLKHLVQPSLRSGLGEWIDSRGKVYKDPWHEPQVTRVLGSLLAVPELGSQEWAPCVAALRSVFLALHSVVWEIGPGRTTSARASAKNGPPLAEFLLAVDARTAVLTIVMKSGKWQPGDLVRLFWDPHPTSPAGLITSLSHLTRVTAASGEPWIEITAVLSNLADPQRSRPSIWIEPVSAEQFVASTTATEARAVAFPEPASEPGGPAFQKLKHELAEKSALLAEMRQGGVGKQPPSKLETHELLEQFQERYFEAKLSLHQMRAELGQLELGRGTPDEIAAKTLDLKQRTEALENRMRRWLGILAGVLELIKKERVS